MKKILITFLAVVALLALATGALADDAAKIKKIEKRLQKLELKANKNKIDWSGDLRIEAHTITGEVPDYFDGMQLQSLMVNSLFAVGGGLVSMPATPGEMATFVDDVTATVNDPAYYVAYQQFLAGLDFESLGQMLAGFSPEEQAGLMGLLLPATYTQGYKIDNDILYSTRLRLNMHAKVARNVNFDARMSMYKPWGASTQVGVFNGQPNTIYMDANEPGVPGASTLHVDRAYFTWSKINDMPLYLSLGRRPSTDGPPLNYRQDEMRGGTPMGTIIDFQFDGATFGYNFSDKTTIRACYGLGYESQYGNGSLLKTPQDRLKDASFFGFNIDAYNTPEMQIQTTVARAFNITDGFNGMVIMPNNPVTGAAMPGPIMTRFSPSANLGDFDLASLMVARTDGPIDWFVTGSWSKSKPLDELVTTPFGGLMADPFAQAEEQTGSMYYLGARYSLDNNKTKIGLEWNKGSQYWFNFAPAQDDIISPKTSTRGTVIEGYVTHRVNSKFMVKLGYINYDYDYSGSGWHLGAPKDLNADEAPILGFPTYKKVGKLSLGFTAKF